MKKIAFIVSTLLVSNIAVAKPIPVAQCGPFELEAYTDGYMHINGVKPWSQKITGAKGNDLSLATSQWMVPYPNIGWLGMNYYVGPEHHRWLDVQYIQPNMDDPKLYGQYECVPISHGKG